MGHDVCGFKGELVKGVAKEEVAYLRRGAFNELGREIYKALGAVDHDCGCSGCGTDKFFTHAEIEAALKKLPLREDLQPEREFLTDCLRAGEHGVTIGFY